MGEELNEVARLWQEHEGSAFPRGHTGKVHGCDLFVLSVEVGTSIVAYRDAGGRLGPHRLAMLKVHLEALEGVLPKLTDPEAKKYFERLRVMGRKVLHNVGVRAA